MANMSAKFDEEAHTGFVSIVFTSLFPYMSIVTLTSDLQNRFILSQVNMSAKLDEEAYNGLVSIVFTRSKRDGHMHTHTNTDGQNHSSVIISLRNTLKYQSPIYSDSKDIAKVKDFEK